MAPQIAVAVLGVLICFSVPQLYGKRSQGQYRLMTDPRPLLQCNPSLTNISDSHVKLFGRHDVGLYATFTNPAEWMNLTQIILSVQKCEGGVRTTNACEHFANWKFPGACGLLAAKGQFWSSILESVHPPVRCPVGGGVIYKMENASLQIDSLMLPRSQGMESSLWITKVSAKNTKGENALCIELEFVFKRVRG